MINNELINIIPYNEDLKDYKFFCFNGEPKFFKIDIGRFSEHHANFYDLNWNILPFFEKNYPPLQNFELEIPLNFDKMIEIARILSKDIPFIRVDLYNVNGKIYFGELTFFPASGLTQWGNENQDMEIGKYLNLKN